MNMPMAFKIFFKKWQSAEIKIIIFVIFIASLILNSVASLNDTLEKNFANQASQLLGAKLIISSSKPIKDNNTIADIQVTRLQSFFTMVNHQDDFNLVQIIAITSPYPLIGTTTLTQKNKSINLKTPPKQNTVWIDSSLAFKLNLKEGSPINIGDHQFIISGMLNNLPGTTSALINLTPTLVINIQDVYKTYAIKPGSRVNYRLLYSGPDNKIQALQNKLKKEIDPHEKIISAISMQQLKTINKNINNVLQITSMFAILLASIALFIASYRYSISQQHTFALLRSLGANSNYLVLIVLVGFIITGFLSALIGGVTSIVIHPLIHYLLHGSLRYSINTLLILNNCLIIVSLLIIFAGANLYHLLNVDPIAIFTKTNQKESLARWVFFLLGVVFIFITLIIKTSSYFMSVFFFYYIGGFYLFSWLVIKLFIVLIDYFPIKLFYPLKLIISNIKREIHSYIIQVLAIGLILVIPISFYYIQSSLFNKWDTTLAENTPNTFLINIQEDQIKALNQLLVKENNKPSMIYPMVRGRLTEINGKSILTLFPDQKRRPNALKRELNLSTMKQLPSHNSIVDGQFISNALGSIGSASIERNLAKRLSIKLNDILTFSVAGSPLTAKVTSIRTVEWQSFKPTFYIILDKQSLDDFAKTYITSLYIDNNHSNLKLQLIKQFPNINLIEIDKIIKQTQQITNRLSLPILIILGFSSAIGLLIVYLIININYQHRLPSYTTLFKLGLSKYKIKRIELYESILIGLLCGIIIALLSNLFNYILIEEFLNLRYQPSYFITALLPLAVTFTMMILNRYSLRNLKF